MMVLPSLLRPAVLGHVAASYSRDAASIRHYDAVRRKTALFGRRTA